MPRRLFVFAGASGSGKSTITRQLAAEGIAEISISWTSRKRAAGERDGVDYNFVDKAEFERLIADDALAEWAMVHGEYYGTGKEWLGARVAAGANVLLEIDVQGTDQLRASMGGVCATFIVPSSIGELERRLRERKREDDAQISKRLRTARREFSRIGDFDHILINDDLEKALSDARAIIRAANGDEGSFRDAGETSAARLPELVAYWTRFGEGDV